MPPGKARLWSTVLLLGLLSSPALAQEAAIGKTADPSAEVEQRSARADIRRSSFRLGPLRP